MATALRVRRPLVRAVGSEEPDAQQVTWVLNGRAAGTRASAHAAGLGWVDLVLIFIFMAGLYTNYTIMLSQKLPFPSAPAGVAGLILLWRRRDDITPRALVGFCAIFTLYLVSILLAPNINWLSRRANGLIQLTYSLAIGYALFLTVKRAERRQIARLFLAFALVILVGCLLETYGGLRPDQRCRAQGALQQGRLRERPARPPVLQSRAAEVLRFRARQRHLLLHALQLHLAGHQPVALEVAALSRSGRPRPVRHARADAAADAGAAAAVPAFPRQPAARPHRRHALSCRCHGRRAVCADGAAAGQDPVRRAPRDRSPPATIPASSTACRALHWPGWTSWAATLSPGPD